MEVIIVPQKQGFVFVNASQVFDTEREIKALVSEGKSVNHRNCIKRNVLIEFRFEKIYDSRRKAV